MTIEALRAELRDDPLDLGYDSLITAKNTQGLADLLNARTGDGAAQLSIHELGHDLFVLGIAPMLLILPSKSDEVQKKWDRLLLTLTGIQLLAIDSPFMLTVYQGLIADGLLTQEEIDSFTKRLGSRAEILFGENTLVSVTDVAKAIWNDNGTEAF